MEFIAVLLVAYVLYRIFKKLSATEQPAKPPKSPEVTVRVEVSGLDGYRSSDYERPERSSGKPAQWYGKGQRVHVQGYEIPGGLVYVGEALLAANGYENDACLINPKLKTAPAEPWEAGDGMGYWPHYAHIPARCRGAYLKWLSGGRCEPEAYIGYVFLFFYGLERRLLVDGRKGKVTEDERAAIVGEVRHLLQIYGANRSFRGYASNFLATEWVLFQRDQPIPDYIDFSDRYCSQPFQVALAQHVVAGKPVPAEMALQWLILHPEMGLRTPARRCAAEFRKLFCQRYAQKFGAGMLINPNKTPLRLEYRSASPSVGGLQLDVPNLPNPFILTEPIKKISALAEDCTVALEPYSRYLGRKENDPQSMSALALLPKELMSQSPGAQKIRTSLAQVCATGPALVPVATLYATLGEDVPAQLGKKESENLAALVEGAGFGIAPDVRFHSIKPDPGGQVAVFTQGHGADFSPSKQYHTIAAILRLGAMVSQIDQEFSPAEEATLEQMVQEVPDLSQMEKASLSAFLHWCMRTPQGTSGLKQRLAEISATEKMAISHILVSVAYADGQIDPKEIRQLEKLYVALGLGKEQVTTDIHTLAAQNEPVTVGLRDPDVVFPIPKPPAAKPTKGFRLNEELVRIREEETRQAKGVLSGIFSDASSDEDGQSATTATPVTRSSSTASLDEAHRKLFYHLITQASWERSALHEICKAQGLMVDGALEVLNEWAFDRANAPLLDDGDPVFIDLTLAKEIADGT